MTLDPSLLLTGAALGILASLAYSLKQMPGKVWNKLKTKFIYTVKVYQGDFLFELLEEYMFKHYSNIYQDVEATIGFTYDTTPKTTDSKNRYSISYRQEDTVFVIHLQGKKILVNKAKTKIDAAQSIRDLFHRHYNISGFRAKTHINALLEQIVSEYNANMKVSFNVYANSAWGEWMHCNELTVKPIDKVVIPHDLKTFLVNDIDEFTNGQSWYHERNIPYKRTYCFHGTPGNGKTTMALSVARYLSRDVYTMSLNTFEKDENMIRAFTNTPKNSVLLIEDNDHESF